LEGDIKAAYDSINHGVLLDLLRRRIKDEKFIQLINKALKAGYMENTRLSISMIGTPQGSVVSPILANIYFHELDKFVENYIRTLDSINGLSKPKTTTEYNALATQYLKIQKELISCQDTDRRLLLIKDLRRIKLQRVQVRAYQDGTVPIHAYYVRYADDWIVGVNGPRYIAEDLKEQIALFLKKNLQLELSEEKTKLTTLKETNGYFLGYEIRIESAKKMMKYISNDGRVSYKRTTGHLVKLHAPIHALVSKLSSK